MPRRSLSQKEQEWHEVDAQINQKLEFAKRVEPTNKPLAQLFRKQASDLEIRKQRLTDLAWRHIESINLETEFRRTISAINKLK